MISKAEETVRHGHYKSAVIIIIVAVVAFVVVDF